MATQSALTAAPNRSILGLRVDSTAYAQAADEIVRWAKERKSRYVCVANVHMVMEAYDRPDFRQIVNGASLTTSDGVPLVWMLRLLGLRHAQRVYGPTLTIAVLQAAEAAGVRVGFYGGRPEVVKSLIRWTQTRFPRIHIAFHHSPPFGTISEEQDAQTTADINQHKIGILFVGLGCPKQEAWMAAHKDRIQAVMLGVGAAFDFLAGAKPQAPGWMQSAGLEWLFRLMTEPRRLWARYLVHNPRFVFLTCLQLAGFSRSAQQ